MKKFILFVFIILNTSFIFADPYFSGKMNLINTMDISEDYVFANKGMAELTLNMDVKSNGVKYYLEGIATTISQKQITTKLNKAYLKYRIPFNSSYMNFQMGKSYYDLGGGLIYNAGNLLLKESSNMTNLPTNWNAILTLPLYQSKNFETLYLGFINIIPIENDSTQIGAFLNYEIGNKYFDNIELSILSDLNKTQLSFGYTGTLYFDYGIYGKLNLQNLEEFDISLFFTKVYDKLVFNCEALYQNNNSIKNLFITPKVTYSINDKLSLDMVLNSSITIEDIQSNNSTSSIYPILNLILGRINYNIVSGFNIYSLLSYNYQENKNSTSISIGTIYKF